MTDKPKNDLLNRIEFVGFSSEFESAIKEHLIKSLCESEQLNEASESDDNN